MVDAVSVASCALRVSAVSAAAGPVGGGVAHQEQLAQVQQRAQVVHGGLKVVGVDEIHREVQLVEELAGAGEGRRESEREQLAVDAVRCAKERRARAPKALDARDIVQRHVQVAQVLAVVQVLDARDDVVLQVQDAQLAARAHGLEALDLELVQRHLLQVLQHAVIVLALFADKFLREPHEEGVSALQG